MNFLNILKGWFNWATNKEERLSKHRMVICSLCPLMGDDGMKYCKVCGCPLEAKTRVLDEECPHKEGNKWLTDN